MTLPRLRADLHEQRAVARVLRCALRHEVQFVPLAAQPTEPGQHLLEVEVPGEGLVTLLADPVGAATAAGTPLQIRPVTRPQMASLLALVERLDDGPSNTVPPPGEASDDAPSEDHTLVDHLDASHSEAPVMGFRGSSIPRSLSSVPPPPRMPSAPPVPAGPFADIIGRVVAGKYRIESPIGSGTSAAVFRAMHMDLGRPVAVKILHEQRRGEMQFVKRFKAEARAASRLEHPNVARIIDFGEDSGLLYIVMELLNGRSLEAILAVQGRLPARKATDLAIQASSALAFAHDIGIIHRDVKPENMMLVPHRDDDGNPCDMVKMCDFGLAKLRDPDPEHADLTVGGMLCGSPAYMSPEQTRGEQLDARTDIYSLGITLYETLSGELPHVAQSLAELFTKKMLEPPRRLSKVVPDIDPVLEDVVMRSIAIDPGKRHSTARVFREELRAALAQLDDDPASTQGGNTIIAD